MSLCACRDLRSLEKLTFNAVLCSGAARRANARKTGGTNSGPARDLSVQPTILKQSRE
eukprot:COSAG02_NODE_5487_length_4287_cov_40.035112_3_plen_58_part_00